MRKPLTPALRSATTERVHPSGLANTYIASTNDRSPIAQRGHAKSKRHDLRLVGDLTIRDLTRPVTFAVTEAGQARGPRGLVHAGFHAETTINRRDWGLTWNVPLETGGWLVSDEIAIVIEVEATRRPA